MIAVIILNYNTYSETISCVESIVNNTKDCEYKIFIVDNGSKNDEYTQLKIDYNNNDRVCVVNNKKNEGYSAGNNVVCKNIDIDVYDKICIMNSDVILKNNALKYMQEAIEDEVVVVGPSIMSAEGKETQILRKYYDKFTYFCSKRPLHYLRNISDRFSIEYEKKDEKTVFFGMVSGCCFMIDSKIFREIGFFDAHIFLYCEEWILAYKLKMKNKKTCYEPKAKIVHYHRRSSKNEGVGFESLHTYISGLYYLKYYCKMNYIGLIYTYLQSIFVFLVRSLYDKSYRRNLKKLIINLNKIMVSKHKVYIR